MKVLYNCYFCQGELGTLLISDNEHSTITELLFCGNQRALGTWTLEKLTFGTWILEKLINVYT